jgi:hypothetical protein
VEHWQRPRFIEVDEQRAHALDIIRLTPFAICFIDANENANAPRIQLTKLAPVFLQRPVSDYGEARSLPHLGIVERLEGESISGGIKCCQKTHDGVGVKEEVDCTKLFPCAVELLPVLVGHRPETHGGLRSVDVVN